jgi:hypothetical protein
VDNQLRHEPVYCSTQEGSVTASLDAVAFIQLFTYGTNTNRRVLKTLAVVAGGLLWLVGTNHVFRFVEGQDLAKSVDVTGKAGEILRTIRSFLDGFFAY